MSSKKSGRTPIALNQKQIKNLWKTNITDYTDENPTKKRHIFNKPLSSTKGKIVIDESTWIDFDFSKDVATKVHHKNESNIPKDIFQLSKYPTLRAIKSEMPDQNDENLKDMDLFLIKDIKEGVLWRNSCFEFYS